MWKALSAIGSFLRTLALVALTAMLGGGGWYAYEKTVAREQELKQKSAQLAAQHVEIQGLKSEVVEKQRAILRLETARRLLKVDHRVAQLRVVEQGPTAEGDGLATQLEFVEVDADGRELTAPRQFTIRGDVVHVDALLIKFSDDAVEQNDPLRSTSICLFTRLYGDEQTPADGFPLDAVGSRPAAYSAGSEASELERELWSQFWDFANHPQRAAQAGVRAMHGEGPFMKVRSGKTYRLLLRASGGLSFVTEESAGPAG